MVVYKDRICKRCGVLVKGDEYGSHAHYPCRACNREFWQKWYLLPAVINYGGRWDLPEEHLALIREYNKEGYFKIKKPNN